MIIVNGKPDFGIFADKNTFNRQYTKDLLSAYTSDKGSGKESDGWPWYITLSYDFNSQNVLEQILPSERENLVKDIADRYCYIINNHTSIFASILDNSKI